MGRGHWQQKSRNLYRVPRRSSEPDWYLIAFCGILLGQIFNRPYFDPAASIPIGVLLFGTAAPLGRESGALLVGERTRRATIRKLERILRDDPSVESVGELLTMQLGPEQVLLTADIRFQRELDLEHLK
jgi:divalent metal cation (Fe/Co/Zn/Cd) transporter